MPVTRLTSVGGQETSCVTVVGSVWPTETVMFSRTGVMLTLRSVSTARVRCSPVMLTVVELLLELLLAAPPEVPLAAPPEVPLRAPPPAVPAAPPAAPPEVPAPPDVPAPPAGARGAVVPEAPPAAPPEVAPPPPPAAPPEVA